MSLLPVCTILLISISFALGQSSTPDALRQHYDSAQSAQAAGQLDRASDEYRAFVAEALRRIAKRWGAAGDLKKATSLLREALVLTPEDAELRLEYAQASRAANELATAKTVAAKLVADQPKNAKAHLELGRTLSQQGDNQAAKQQLERAVALDPDFENGYALAIVELKLKDLEAASTIFAEMQKGIGDTAEIHMRFGRAYAETGYSQQAIHEFQKALAKDSKIAGAHYSLGATYLIALGDAALNDATKEFQAELQNHPDDFYSLFQLGNIALGQHRLADAERDLSRATSLQPRNPDPFLSLGQTYVEMNRPAEAEAALRQSIALTQDPSRNHFQIQRAHYLLGRLLVQQGHPQEAQQELKVAAELLKQVVAANQGVVRTEISPHTAESMQLEASKEVPEVDLTAVKEITEFEARIDPAIADSYNNLGAIAAGRSEFLSAFEYFQNAAKWNPSLEGIDYNLGRAAFSARQYAQAVAPLEKSLAARPTDAWTRAALGSSYFWVQRYADAVRTLQPMEAELSSSLALNFVYSVAMVKAGEFAEGVKRLEDLQKANPAVAAISVRLGEAYSSQGDYARAAEEYQAALKLDPADTSTEYQLAMSLLHLQRKPEVVGLLKDAVRRGSKDADVYYQLGTLQLENGEVKEAIASLEAAAQMDPGNDRIHYQLAEAYRRDSRSADADREMSLYQQRQKANAEKQSSSQPN